MMTRNRSRFLAAPRLGAAVLLCCAVSGAGALASESPGDVDEPAVLTLQEAAQLLRVEPGEVERLARENEIPARRIASTWRFNREALLAWLNGEWELIATAVPADAVPAPLPSSVAALSEPLPVLSNAQMAGVIGAGAAQAAAPVPTPDAASSEPAQPIGEAPEERRADDIFLRGQKVLLEPGQVVWEVGQFYTRFDYADLALSGNDLALADIEFDSFTTLLQGRVGIFDETELFVGTTINHDIAKQFVGATKIDQSRRTELGDIRLGVRRTLLREGPGRPDIIASIEGSIPTGETSYAIGGGLAVLKSIDPVILFANANFQRTFSRNFSDPTRLEPENTFDVTLGYAMALNDTLSISTSVSGLFTSATSFGNVVLRQNDFYSMQFALTSWLAQGLYIEPSVSFALSGPGNAVAFGVTVPFSP